jgi:hypothetical protein
MSENLMADRVLACQQGTSRLAGTECLPDEVLKFDWALAGNGSEPNLTL